MTELNGVDYIGLSSSELHGRNFDQETSRSAVGQPIGSFFVYEADGLFQSDAEIQNYKNDRVLDLRISLEQTISLIHEEGSDGLSYR